MRLHNGAAMLGMLVVLFAAADAATRNQAAIAARLPA